MAGRLWRGLWRLGGVLLLAIVAVVAALRFVNPPATAFMLHARMEAWWEGDSMAIAHRWVPAGCIAGSLKLAVMAAEDQKFAAHRGFDLDQIADALQTAGQGGRLRGASTLSQQTVKNLFLWPGQSWLRKGLEAGLTVLVEALWPKTRILEVYLNVAELGPGVYGAAAAAERYFGKPAADLTASESALLAAVLPNPRMLRAGAPSAYVRERQVWIRAQMRQVERLAGVGNLLAGPAAPRCDHRASESGS